MRILVLGASGSIGRLLVTQALARGHAVTALVREPARLPLAHVDLRTLTGSVLDADSLEEAIEGQDAVISALGSRTRTRRVQDDARQGQRERNTSAKHDERRPVGAGPNPDDHGFSSATISRTARSRPTSAARAMMLWPMFNSTMCGEATMGRTLM